MPTDPQHQLELFRQAVAAVGGQHAAARCLRVTARTIGKLCSDLGAPNHVDLHDGHLRDIGRALVAHAERCKALERAVSPAFASNLTAGQLARQGKPDGRRFDASFQHGLVETIAPGGKTIEGMHIAPGYRIVGKPDPGEIVGDDDVRYAGSRSSSPKGGSAR